VCLTGEPSYEAGPCGHGWARYLNAQGWRCEIISPAHITRKGAEKLIKTDRLDAVLLARESGAARLRARLQLRATLLRHGRAYHGKSSWTAAHERHLAHIEFDHPAQQIAFDEYRHAVKDAHERVERLTQALREQCEQWR
jgi:transposase